ncbi:MAG: 1-acyl-sn-glycerol-3-phosphate acyltransferase [Paludibacteraceae bacterium]|nr:1-acyl-sn-glycerol-3-phosphate acyltransferase [Paludibacteraceae bacterium]
MNKQYEQLRVVEGEYIPQPVMDYPQDNPFARTLFPVFDRELTIDEHYPYLDDTAAYKWKTRFAYSFILKTCLNLMLHVKMGLRIRGREILKKHKQGLKNGAITIANHVYRLDCPCVLLAVRAKRTTRIPMFAPNFRTKDSVFLNIVGGVPIPDPDAGMSAMKKFNEAFDEFHRRGWWFHIFPEACRWDFYKPLRPFQKGAFTMSYKYDKPILPCVITFRERKGVFRLFGPKELPLLTVTIGEPIYPDTTQPRKIEVDRMRDMAHTQMQQMAGIIDNPWPAAWGGQ